MNKRNYLLSLFVLCQSFCLVAAEDEIKKDEKSDAKTAAPASENNNPVEKEGGDVVNDDEASSEKKASTLGRHFSSARPYGGFAVNREKIGNANVSFFGFRGALIFDNGFGVGFVTNMMTSERSAPRPYHDLDLDFRYSGLFVEYTFMRKALVHPVLTLIAGNGRLSYLDTSDDRDKAIKKDYINYLQPEIAAEVNLHTYIRAALAVSRRMVRDTEIAGLEDKDLEKPTLSLVFKFGMF